MKVKLRLLEGEKTIDFKVLRIKNLREIPLITGVGLDDRVLAAIADKGKARIRDKKTNRILELTLTND